MRTEVGYYFIVLKQEALKQSYFVHVFWYEINIFVLALGFSHSMLGNC